MPMSYMRVAGAVVGVALAAFVVYGFLLGVSSGGGVLHWAPVVEGALIGAAVLAVWNLASTRNAAVFGLTVAVVVVVVGAAGFDPARAFAQGPMGWATMLALIVRLAAPHAASATEDRRELTEV
jgi:hypothetical protein